MMEMITDILLNAGPIGALALYMMYLNNKQENKHDNQQQLNLNKIEMMRSNDEAAREAMQNKYEKREDQIRDKYDKVIAKIDLERRDQEKEIANSINKAVEKIDSMSTRVDTLNARFDDINTKIMSTNQKVTQLEAQVSRLDGALDGIKAGLINRQ
jgi:chromosome segregation ATPase